ncbi:MAG TPA: hypothetical protein VEQ85_01650 [Lacipirellulaceae bacterium]|nr:hypothetical protein [Lacipirellulaceae bacterium]
MENRFGHSLDRYLMKGSAPGIGVALGVAAASGAPGSPFHSL